MNGRHVQRVVAITDAQEAGGLLEVLGPMPGTLRNCTRERKRPFSFRNLTMFMAVRSVIPAT